MMYATLLLLAVISVASRQGMRWIERRQRPGADFAARVVTEVLTVNKETCMRSNDCSRCSASV